MAFDQMFNLFEGLIWTAIAAVFFVKLRRAGENRDLLKAAGLAFLVFGITDFVEIRTRAWYEPLPLLLLNAACVLTFAVLLFIHRKRRAAKPS